MAKRGLSVMLLGSALCGSCGEGIGGTQDDGVTPARPGALISEGDDRIEATQVTDPNLSKFVGSVAAMFRGGAVTDNGDGTSTIGTIPYNTFFGQPLCPGTKFASQPVGSGLACTSFLVAPDMVATANHCLTQWGWTWDTWKFIFDYTYPVNTWITNTRIFRPTAVLYSDTHTDMALLQLDRAVPEWRATFPLDPSGPATVFQLERFIDSVAAFGFGNGLAMKYSPNTGPWAGAWAFADWKFLSFLDILEGNSGSPVFDTATSVVRGVATGEYVQDYVQDPSGCLRLNSVSPADGKIQNGLESSYVQPLANLIAPAGSPIEPNYRSDKTLAYAPSSVVMDSGDEYLFATASDYRIYFRHRDAQNTWSAWSEVPGFGQLRSTPVAVAGQGNDLWLWGRDSSGTLVFNRRYASGSWSNWGTVDTPVRLASDPAAFSFDTTSGGVLVRVVVVSMLGTDGHGYMKYLTYRQDSAGNWYTWSNAWQAGAYATVATASSVATGFGGPNSGIATIADASHTLNCVRGLLSSIPGQNQTAAVTWSACVRALPTNLQVLSAQGVGLPDGSQYVVARGLDDTNMVVSRPSATGTWGSWAPFGGRSFATPSITKSLGTWWTYTLAADRRVAIK